MNDVNKKVDSIREFFKKNQPKNHPIENHPIGECEEYVKNLYFDMLCVIAQYENEDVENQNKFIERIMVGSNETMPISEHIKRAMSITVDTITEFIKQCKDNHLNEIFFIDSLIISCGNGTPNRKQVEFLSEFADVFGFDKKKVNFFSMLALSILEDNFEKLKNTFNDIPIDANYIIPKVECYTQPIIDKNVINDENNKYYFSLVVSDTPLFSENVTISNPDNIIIENQLLKDTTIKFNSIKSVTLKNCVIKNNSLRFDGVQQVNIEECFFDFKKISNYLYIESNCKIIVNNSKFINLSNNNTGVFFVKNGQNCTIDIYDCRFEDCSSHSGIIVCTSANSANRSKVNVTNCYFSNCHGHNLFYDCDYTKENCTFINCCRETN